MHIVIATSPQTPALDASDQLYGDALQALGATVSALPWTAIGAARLQTADAVVLRSTWGYHNHVAAFRDYLRANSDSPEGQELLAAKFMGRWRSGAPLVLTPDRDDPELGADPMRNNDFNYKEMDPFGYACPLGSHVRRLNPRDTAHYMNRRRMIRRGATYGPALPEGAPDDGVDRGIAAFIICSSK